MVLICHVISQDHVTNEYSNIIDRSRFRLVTFLPSLVAIASVVVSLSRDLIRPKDRVTLWIEPTQE